MGSKKSLYIYKEFYRYQLFLLVFGESFLEEYYIKNMLILKKNI